MLSYFVKRQDIPEAKKVCILLDRFKKRLLQSDFSGPDDELNTAMELFPIILEKAIEENNEFFANSEYIFKAYFIFFEKIAAYNVQLSKKEYRGSWNVLQDCFDILQTIKKYTDPNHRYELTAIERILLEYEKFYGYTKFLSPEIVVAESECSICGKSMQDLSCPHQCGNLYWGKMATKIVTKVDELKGVAIVSNPDDKRCVLEIQDDRRSQEEKFPILDEFIKMKVPFFTPFSIEVKEELIKKIFSRKIGRNEPCPCGSGKKFKHCCGVNLYRKHFDFIIVKESPINMCYFGAQNLSNI